LDEISKTATDDRFRIVQTHTHITDLQERIIALEQFARIVPINRRRSPAKKGANIATDVVKQYLSTHALARGPPRETRFDEQYKEINEL
jgi:hypothetical protein